ncbi:NlpC/P60 family protein [uncultured Planococcus sp.]|uniref:C40 family peptidase n=1 Tax=uncultured Planococcus sp. TaxID=337815 RepID=UPI002637F5B3|nr:NlpC/P60 family protein [uncultured Planococcus sp.]
MAETYEQALYNGNRPAVDVQIYDGQNVTHLNDLTTGVTVSGDVAQACRKCEISLANSVDGEVQRFSVSMGFEVRVYIGSDEVFRGPIFAYNLDDRGMGTIVAYDYNYYLTKTADSLRFDGKKASQIIMALAGKFGIDIGAITDTGYIIPKHIYRDKTLYDMMIIALTETEKKNGRKFSLVNRWGKLYVKERKEELRRVVIENGRTLLSASYSKSNEDRSTTVKLVGNADVSPIAGTAKSADSVKAYGTMQHYEIIDEPLNKAQLDAMARKILETLDVTKEEYSVEALGLFDVISGTAIVVNDRMSNMYGAFYVDQDTHTFDVSGLHTMSLKLSRTLDIPREDYEEPEKAAAKSTSSGGTTTTTGAKLMPSGDYQKGFVATAYDPVLGGINANGDPGNTATMTKPTAGRTIAVDPRVIPYGSVVAIKIPSMPKYNGLYLAEDTGGAIKQKRIDIIIDGRTAAMNFGRRDVEVAIIERGKGPADARAKSKSWSKYESKHIKTVTKTTVTPTSASSGDTQSKVVAGARKYLGKLKYSFGGANIPGGYGDCSSYTQFIYKTYGNFTMGRDTLSQIKVGQKISSSKARAGDLIFFKGTYRAGVSHVGIVTKPGMFINLAGGGCYEASYVSGYWAKHYMQINRVLNTKLEDGSVVPPSWFR